MSQAKIDESIVWKQFKKRPIGVFSLYVIMTLFAVAIYAPMIANSNPIALKSTYGVLYEYYWAGWQAVQATSTDALVEYTQLKALEKSALEGYDAERDALRTLMVSYNEAGNRYDSARDQVNALQEQIDVLTEQLTAAREVGQPTAEMEAQVADLDEQRKVVAESRKEVGGEKAQIKRELDERRGRQGDLNQDILKARFRLDFESQRTAVLLNIKQMKNFVDDSIATKLDGYSTRYDAAFAKVLSASDPTALAEDLRAINSEAMSEVGPDTAKAHLEYKWIFPVLSQLDSIDRLFCFGYPIFVLLLLLGTRLRYSLFERIIITVVAATILSAATPLFSWDLPARNYQNLMLDNIGEGYDQTFAFMAPVPYGMNENRFEEQYHKPSFVADESGFRSRHLLGTDDSGRDVAARMIWGARVSLSVGFVAVGLYLLIGIVVGSLAGYFGGKVDLALSRIIEIVICFPSLFLILTVIAFIGPSIYNVMIVIGLTGWTGIARLTRAEFLRLRGQDFVVAAQATGNIGAAVMFKHILPNAMTPVLVSAAFGFAGSILMESGLSFLGFGVQEPFPSWGQMLAAGRANPLLYWWLFIVPGIALFVTVTVYNLAGNAFRDASDPRLRK